MALEKLPTVITDSQFTEDGFVVAAGRLLVPAYVGSQFGFSSKLFEVLNNDIYQNLLERGVLPVCPFAACAEYLGPFPTDEEPFAVHQEYWAKFNKLVGPVNYETLMPRSQFMVALLDGGHTIDDGVAAEISYFDSKIGRPVIGIRSDFRLAENLAAPINPAVSYFMENGRCALFVGRNAYEAAYENIEQRVQTLLRDRAA